MVGVEEGREFRFRGDLYSQESTFPLVTFMRLDCRVTVVCYHILRSVYSKNCERYAASKYTGIVCRIFLHRFHRLTSHHSHHPSPLHAEIGFVGLNFCKTEFLYAWQRYKCCRR